MFLYCSPLSQSSVFLHGSFIESIFGVPSTVCSYIHLLIQSLLCFCLYMYSTVTLLLGDKDYFG